MKNLTDFQAVADDALFAGPGNTLSQSFISHSQNIAGIRLRPYNPRLGGNLTYQISILDENNKVIRSIDIKESNVSWGSLLRIELPQLENTYGKKYIITILFKDSQPQDQKIVTALNNNRLNGVRLPYTIDEIDKAQKSYISFAYSNKDAAPGDLFWNTEKQNGDMEYYIYEQVTPIEFAINTIKSLPNKIKADPGFFSLYFILLIFLFFLVFSLMIRRLRKS